jgi:hypothetical protein
MSSGQQRAGGANGGPSRSRGRSAGQGAGGSGNSVQAEQKSSLWQTLRDKVRPTR